jgi:hypothetical protein
MDALLAQLFLDSGGELRLEQRWPEKTCGEGVVRASGRRLQPKEKGWRWLGLKVHARNVAGAAHLEMHGLRAGYVGLCRLDHEEVNVCGLFRLPPTPSPKPRSGGVPPASSPGVPPGGRPAGSRAAAQPWQEILRGTPGTPLHERVGRAVFEEGSFCSVAGISLQPHRASERPECCLGDALTMIPPVTGNGMSMAFEAAEMAAAPLAAYSRGEISWALAQQTVARACDDAFARRLAWARWLQWMMFTPALRGPLCRVALDSGCLWRWMFARTR